MNTTRIALIGVISLSLAAAPVARAQYTQNYQTNIISGVTSNWVGDYLVGSNTFADVLLIRNSGVLSNGYGYLGYEVSSSNNSVLVTGVGSVWSNSADLYVGYSGADNSLVISNGGQVINNAPFGSGFNCYIGYNSSSSNNSVLVTGTGSVWSIYYDLYVGNSGTGNSLVISNGSQVVSIFGNVFDGYSGANNSVLVTGTGSVWSIYSSLWVGSDSSNSLVISSGGKVVSVEGIIGLGGEGNSVLVTGTGSVWSNSSELDVGYEGSSAGSSLVINNGGQVASGRSTVGLDGSGGSVLVTGSGSVWSNGELALGTGGGSSDYGGFLGNSLVISNGGRVVSSSGVVGDDGNPYNTVLVTGNGSIWSNSSLLIVGSSESWSNSLVINNGGQVASDGDLHVRRGALTLNSGTVTVDSLIATNGASSVITFNGGKLQTKGTAVTNGQQFVVGDGVDAATFHLLGGTHSFANGLEISNNATLTGCGTISGSVLVDAGGTVLTDCGGTLTFTGAVTNNGTMHAISGTTLEFYGPVVNNGRVDVIDGHIIFHDTFTNNGTFADAYYFRVVSITPQADDIKITWTTIGGDSYVVQTNAPPLVGSYTNNFTDLSPTIVIPGLSLGTTNYLDVGGATNRPARYYRIHLSSSMPVDP